jgi:hypothetical protein
VLDAALIAGAQKVEHYEIASYGTLAYFADILGQQEAKELLGETLDEEKAADEKLTSIATSKVNREALMRGNEDEDEEGSSQRGGMVWSGLRRGASAMGLAQDRGSSSRSRSSSRSARSSGRSSSSGSRSSSSARRRSMSSKKR